MKHIMAAEDAAKSTIYLDVICVKKLVRTFKNAKFNSNISDTKRLIQELETWFGYFHDFVARLINVFTYIPDLVDLSSFQTSQVIIEAI